MAGTIALGETALLEDVVWPKGDRERKACFHIWKQQDMAVTFATHEFLGAPAPVVVQRINGPCGLIAAVQAELLSLEPGQTGPALLTVVASMINRVRNGPAMVVLSAIFEDLTDASSQAGQGRVGVASFGDGVSVDDLISLQYADLLAKPGGSILLLYSLTLSHGVSQVQAELQESQVDQSLVVYEADSAKCSDGLVCLALYGRAFASFNEEWWPDTLPTGYGVGILSGQDEQLQEPTPCTNLRNPNADVWVVLSGGHWTVLTRRASWVTPCTTVGATKYLQINGLCSEATPNTSFRLVCAEAIDSGDTGSVADLPEHTAIGATDILMRRETEGETQYYVMCLATGSLEGRPRSDADKWYCRRCFQETGEFSYNAASAVQCERCGGEETVVGHGHWLSRQETPPTLLHRYLTSKLPSIGRVLACLSPRTSFLAGSMVECRVDTAVDES